MDEINSHYTKLEIEPWQIIRANKLNFFEASALKYLLRYKSKNGLEDLEKIKVYVDELIKDYKVENMPPQMPCQMHGDNDFSYGPDTQGVSR